MSSERYRPSDSQIHNHYRCNSCQRYTELELFFAAPMCCGEEMAHTGESYPANSDDWDEELNDSGDWQRRR